jgi:hypothetical protein
MPEYPYLQWPVFRRSIVAAFQRSLTLKRSSRDRHGNEACRVIGLAKIRCERESLEVPLRCGPAIMASRIVIPTKHHAVAQKPGLFGVNLVVVVQRGEFPVTSRGVSCRQHSRAARLFTGLACRGQQCRVGSVGESDDRPPRQPVHCPLEGVEASRVTGGTKSLHSVRWSRQQERFVCTRRPSRVPLRFRSASMWHSCVNRHGWRHLPARTGRPDRS